MNTGFRHGNEVFGIEMELTRCFLPRKLDYTLLITTSFYDHLLFTLLRRLLTKSVQDMPTITRSPTVKSD